MDYFVSLDVGVEDIALCVVDGEAVRRAMSYAC